MDNQQLFPDVCTESGKRFRGTQELFHGHRANDILSEKSEDFQSNGGKAAPCRLPGTQ
jgi:hypothetical protein